MSGNADRRTDHGGLRRRWRPGQRRAECAARVERRERSTAGVRRRPRQDLGRAARPGRRGLRAQRHRGWSSAPPHRDRRPRAARAAGAGRSPRRPRSRVRIKSSSASLQRQSRRDHCPRPRRARVRRSLRLRARAEPARRRQRSRRARAGERTLVMRHARIDAVAGGGRSNGCHVARSARRRAPAPPAERTCAGSRCSTVRVEPAAPETGERPGSNPARPGALGVRGYPCSSSGHLLRHPAHRAQAPRQLHRRDPELRRGPGPRRPGDLLHRRPARDDGRLRPRGAAPAHRRTPRRCWWPPGSTPSAASCSARATCRSTPS